MIGRLPTNWTAAKLSEICQINPRGKSGLAEDDEVSFVPMSAVSEISGSIIAAETKQLWDVQKGFTPFQEGDVLFAKITPCMENGKAAIARNLINQRGYGSTEFHVLRPSSLVLAEWVFAIIRTSEFRRAAEGSFQGAAGQRRVPGPFLENFRIPLPPLTEQQRIVEILQEAEEIRRLRGEVEAKTSELIPAIFADTFGDLYFVKSPFPVQLLSSIGELDRGRSKHRPRDEASLYGGPYPFLQTGDVAQANGWITTYTQTYSERGLEQSRLWPKGTLAITIAANIGLTAILTFDACFPDSVVGFTPHSGISVEYVRWWLLGYQKKLEIQAPQGAQKNINLEVLRSIQIPVPPTDLQMKFQAAILNLRGQIDASSTGAKSLASLFASLTAHAFSGELTAEWRDGYKDNLASEARDRDAALKEAGATIFLSRRTMEQEIGEMLRDRTDGIYADLNREQQHLLQEIKQMVKGVEFGRYFTAEKLASYVKGSLHRHPQKIESHLTVFAVRGIIIPVSRPRSENTGPSFAACYRLPVNGLPSSDNDAESGQAEGDDIRTLMMAAQRKLASGNL
jgi:type I restriction enzyme S subunit